jgi:predicted GTPase
MAASQSVATDLTPEAKEKLKKLLDESRTLSILFTGKTGVGKSSLANALVGREVSPEGESLNPETLDVFNYRAAIAGVDVTIWDCPGLQDGTSNEAEYLNKMATKCKELDLVLYCTRMDDTRIRDEDYETIKTLTRAFGEGIWENAIFTLTFANEVKKAVRTRSRGQSASASTAPPVDQKEFFLSRLSQWESKLKEALLKAGVSQEIIRKTIVVPVGYQDDLSLPDRNNWLSKFWLTCLQRINKRATLALLKISANRLPERGDLAEVDLNELDVGINEIEAAFLSMTGGFAIGAVAGTTLGPVGTVVGAAAGMLAGSVSVMVHMLKEDAKLKDKDKTQ